MLIRIIKLLRGTDRNVNLTSAGDSENILGNAIMGKYRTSTGPMLSASDQYWPGTGPYWHVYRDGPIECGYSNVYGII